MFEDVNFHDNNNFFLRYLSHDYEKYDSNYISLDLLMSIEYKNEL